LEFLTAKQFAEKLGVTPRRVQDMCRQGAIKGVVRHGREWLIPLTAIEKKEKNGASVEEKHPEAEKSVQATEKIFNGILDSYKKPGSAAEILLSLSHDETQYDIFASQLAFYRGDYKTALTLAMKYIDDKETDINIRVAVGMQLTLASLFIGDYKVWRKGFDYIKATDCNNEYEKHALEFWCATAISSASDEETFPDWFRRGDFTRLPPNHYPIASYNYVKHLYHACGRIKNKEKTFELLRAMPYVIEPLISYACSSGAVIVEIYLRLVCALAYHLNGNDAVAIPHLDRAIDLALPDKLYTPLAEYRRRFGFLMDDRVALRSADALADIKSVSKTLIDGWTAIHNEMLGKRVSSNLSVREWQAARLAAYGLQNKEIADIMGVTVNAVKQSLRMAMDKTGCESRDELSQYI
jgi:DNA-binding CsgD family transcriptional regulator